MAKNKVNKEDIIKDRLAYIGTLASGLAHEINNPLNSISLNIDLIEDDIKKLDEDIKKKLGRKVSRIKSETQNLQKILGEFLAFARPPQLDIKVLDLNDFIYDIIEFLQPELKKSSIAVRFDLDKELYPIMVDPRQFHQVFINLIKNAMEAIREKKPDKPFISIATKGHDHYLEIKIADNGEEIPENFKEKIFEVFFTTKDNGTGLGLGIVTRILREHQGSLHLEIDQPEPGAKTFTIILPKSINLGYDEEGNLGDLSKHE